MFRLAVLFVISFAVVVPLTGEALTPAGAQALESRGDWKGAERVWRELIRQAPDDYRYWTSLGIVLARQEQLRDAIAAYHKALAIEPHATPAELNLGLAYFKMGNFTGAIPLFHQVMKAQPDNQQVRLLLGMSLYGVGQFREAAAYLQAAAERDPANMQLRQALAQSYLSGGEYDKAKAEFEQMLKRDPNSPAVHMLLGEAYDGLNQPKEAIAEYRAATSQGYLPNAHFGLGYLLWKDRRYDEAAAEFRKELASDPSHAQAMAYLGDVVLKQGDAKTAEEILRQSVAHQMDIRIAHLDLGVIYSDQKRYQAATAQLKQAIALDPERADAHYRLARVYRETGDMKLAEAQLALVKKLHEKTNEDLIVKISGQRNVQSPNSK